MAREVVSRLVPGAAVVALLVSAVPAHGQVIVPPTPANKASVSVTHTVTYDSSTGLYTYNYTVLNDAASQQAIWLFALRLNAPADVKASPAGWTAADHDDRPILSWAATDTGPLPPDYVDDGNLPPSPFTIAPGVSRAFSLTSPNPPGSVTFFAQGDTKLPQVAGDLSDLPLEGTEIPDFTQDSVGGETVGPVPLDQGQYFAGGRRPAVDGFLVFLNLADGDTRSTTVGVVIRFGIGGETVHESTFHATLNGTDVTASFVPGANPGERVALFEVGSSPLAAGRNVLLTSVDGVVPGTVRDATDVDRVTFTVR